MINLNTCVKGQKLRLRNGRILTYVQDGWSSSYPHETRTEEGDCFSYTCNGSYRTDGAWRTLDVVEILPLETTGSPKPSKHPSVVWWESCPWITDRKPTKEDADDNGWVVAKRIELEITMAVSWTEVKAGKPWIHRQDWQPPTLTDKQQALQLINNHEDGWRPTPEQWNVIRKGLKAW